VNREFDAAHYEELRGKIRGVLINNVAHLLTGSQAVADYLGENASFLVMAGPKPIAEGRITKVLWKPRS
jgi:hypothetical protein